MTTTIYLLSDPNTGRVRYVGKTVKPLSQRLSEHVSTAKTNRRPCHRNHWIASFGKARPLITEVEVVTGPAEDAAEAERRWIASLRADGCDLVNATAGGEGVPGHRHGPEARAAMSAKAKARMADPLWRQILSERARGRTPSAETRALMSRLAKARGRTPEHNAKLAESKRGRRFSDSHRKALSLAHMGQRRSPEASAKAAAANRGRKRTAEQRARMSAGRRARLQ